MFLLSTLFVVLATVASGFFLPPWCQQDGGEMYGKGIFGVKSWWGYEFNGNTIKQAKAFGGVGECNNMCRFDDNCEFFVMDSEQNCWLKNDFAGKSFNMDKVSYAFCPEPTVLPTPDPVPSPTEPAAPPAPPQASCIVADKKYEGEMVIREGLLQNIANAETCLERCRAHEDCEFFNFDKYKNCYLKKDQTAITGNGDWVSGLAECPDGNAKCELSEGCGACEEAAGYDFKGLTIAKYNADRVSGCRLWCTSKAECEFFSFSKGICLLRRDFNGAVEAADVTSGMGCENEKGVERLMEEDDPDCANKVRVTEDECKGGILPTHVLTPCELETIPGHPQRTWYPFPNMFIHGNSVSNAATVAWNGREYNGKPLSCVANSQYCWALYACESEAPESGESGEGGLPAVCNVEGWKPNTRVKDMRTWSGQMMYGKTIKSTKAWQGVSKCARLCRDNDECEFFVMSAGADCWLMKDYKGMMANTSNLSYLPEATCQPAMPTPRPTMTPAPESNCDYEDEANGPFALDCLQKAFLEAGCSMRGEEYPTEDNVAKYVSDIWGDVIATFDSLNDASLNYLSECHGFELAERPTEAGCYYILPFGCEKDADLPTNTWVRDIWAENERDALAKPERCSSRAYSLNMKCGFDTTFPLTHHNPVVVAAEPTDKGCFHIFPTGCKSRAKMYPVNQWMRDTWGEANMNTLHDAAACEERGRAWDKTCGLEDFGMATRFFHNPPAGGEANCSEIVKKKQCRAKGCTWQNGDCKGSDSEEAAPEGCAALKGRKKCKKDKSCAWRFRRCTSVMTEGCASYLKYKHCKKNADKCHWVKDACEEGQDTAIYCSTLRRSVNGDAHPPGCPGAVTYNGTPEKTYCTGDNGRFPWYSTCCDWANNLCVPKNIKAEKQCSQIKKKKNCQETEGCEFKAKKCQNEPES